MKKLLLLFAVSAMTLSAGAQRVVDKLDRGIVAVPGRSGGNLVSWRIFGSEYFDVEYNLYRNGTKVNSTPIKTSNYQDAAGNSSSRYQVAPVVRGVEQEKSAEVRAWSSDTKFVPVLPVVNRDGKTIANSVAGNSGGADTTTPGYTLNDISLADVDGDGVAEFLVKRNNSQGNLRSASNRTDFNLYECYKMDGTRLWWIDLGPNLMAGADEQWDMIGYDWDEDGKAECIMRGADNMIIHTASGKNINIGNMTAGFGYERPEYMGVGKEYLLYLNGETGEPYGWDGEENWTPMAYPLPQFEANETEGDANVWGDLGHRMMKHYFGAPYIDGRHASIFLGRGCYTRHKACALDVNRTTHELTVRWRWNCYDGGSPWFGNGFHNFAIADVDMDGRDEIVYGSMILDDTGYGLCTSGLGHGDAQHCGDLDPYRWGLEQFTCQEGSQGNSYWNATTGEIYYRKQDGGDDGRALAGNFTNLYPGSQGRSVSSGVIGLSSGKIIDGNGDTMSGSYANLNNRIYWDGDLLDEIFNSKNGANRAGNVFKWGGSVIKSFSGITNNWTKCNPSAQGDIIGDWREELVLRLADNTGFHIYCTDYYTEFRMPTLWHDHEYRNGMAWQCIGYNQPPHVSYFIGELEGITQAPPPLVLEGRTELSSGATITAAQNDEQLLLCPQADAEVTVQEGASPWVFIDNAACWVQGSGDKQATRSTPKSPARTYIYYKHTVKGAGFSGNTHVVKQGEGILELPAVEQTYTGPTDVWNGTLVFSGSLLNSPLWLNRHTSLITDGGRFGSVVADYNTTITIGDGTKSQMQADSLALNFGSRVVFDLFGDVSSDVVKARVISLEKKTWQHGPKYSTPVFQFNINGDDVTDGRYLLAEVERIDGNIEDIVLEGIGGKRNLLSYEDGKLYLDIETFRAPTQVVWNGSADNNDWDFGVTKNFLNNGVADYSGLGDDIVFDDNAIQTNVHVKGAVRPASITFNNETKTYVVSGDSIMNEAPITKNGAGTSYILSENRTGNTVVNGGTLVVNYLANTIGQLYGALGDARKTITLNDGTTLQSTEAILTDQQIYVNGEATISVASGKSFTLNKGFRTNSSGILHKTGAGSMTMGTAHTISKLLIDQGTVTAIASNNVDQLPATVEFGNGTLWGSTMDDTPGRTTNANFIVQEGKKATYYGPYRGTINGKLTGSGTFTVYSGGVRCYWNGDWSGFEGTLIPATTNRQAKPSYDPSFDWNNSYGLPKATLQLNSGITFNYGGNSLALGNITGEGTLNGTGAVTLGGRNEDINFKGTLNGMAVVKTGTGTWTINSASKQLSVSRLFVNQGTLYLYTVNNSTAIVNPNATVTVRDGATLQGTAIVPALAAESGAIITIGRQNATNPSGELKVTKNCNLKAGSVLNLRINRTGTASSARTVLTVGTTLAMNATVNLTMADTYEPQEGDEFQLWSCASTFSGTPVLNLPELPEGLAWDTTDLLTKNGTIRVARASAIFQHLADTAPVECTLYTLDGQQVAQFQATKATVARMARQNGLKAGTYVLRFSNGTTRGTQKVLVR